MKILSVDDSLVMLRIIGDAASVIGAETVTARNGSLALKVLEEQGAEINMILLDWNMPGMTGLEFLQKVKGDGRWKDIPVMMVTSEGNPENVKKALMAGATNYLVKPFAQEDLETKIMQCLGQGF